MASLFGDLIAGGLSFLGSREQGRAATSAAEAQAAAIRQQSADALAAAEPWSIGSLGGTVDFDTEGRLGTLMLSPELKDIYQGALARSGLWGAQALEYGLDPFAAADVFYQQQEPMFTEQENRKRTEMETRLMAQGRLGSTGGAQEQRALEEAIGTGQLQRRNESFNRAQALISTLLGRESGDLARATGLLNIPLQQANVSRGIAGTLGQTASAGLASQAQAEQLLARTQAAAGTPMSAGLLGLGDVVRRNYGTNP